MQVCSMITPLFSTQVGEGGRVLVNWCRLCRLIFQPLSLNLSKNPIFCTIAVKSIDITAERTAYYLPTDPSSSICIVKILFCSKFFRFDFTGNCQQ